MNAAETHRERAVEALFATEVFRKAWETWRPHIQLEMSSPAKIYDLGSKISLIFQTTAEGRGQTDVSGAGNAWECLVCWYLNLIFLGTGAVAVKQKRALVPSCISDATAIVYGNSQTNTESDLVVYILPDDPSLSATTYGDIQNLNQYISTNCRDVTIGVVQCKTNWNDNSQIPMLWDMIYRSEGFRGTGIHIGKNGITIRDFKEFSYSFVTVPSQKDLEKKFKPDSMAVKRVRGLSGGNYWGRSSVNGVALSLNEIFRRNFSRAFDNQPVQNKLSVTLSRGIPDYFRI
ncbi:hypothetical protein ACIQT7_07045 [Agrobacterium deltaense]